MAIDRIEVRLRDGSEWTFVPRSSTVDIGRSPDNHLVVNDPQLSLRHARLRIGAEQAVIEDRSSSGQTVVVRQERRITLDDTQPRVPLVPLDLVELWGDGSTPLVTLRPVFAADVESTEVVAVRPIAEIVQRAAADPWTDAARQLQELDHGLGAESSLEQVQLRITDAALVLIPRATHATLVLCDEPSPDSDATPEDYGPVLTRTRTPNGELATDDRGPLVVRSVYRRVLQEKSAVLAADAPREALDSESLLGAKIRSTLAVPLWKGSAILGVLQVDNRDAPGVFGRTDLEILGVFACSASLALSNARLIHRLQTFQQRLRGENSYLRQREEQRQGRATLVYQSPAMTALMDQIERVAPTRVPVLIEGETGVGKELVAACLHRRSGRHERLFTAQNCAALPEALLESELFGHRRGAFTGAHEDRRGLFEVADGGTLFLDEVTEMSLGVQAKLLRVLQEGEIRPVGAAQTRPVNVRVIAATNRNLQKEVAEGRFREDLYYRLAVFPLHVPALRERPDDIWPLFLHWLSLMAEELGKSVPTVDPQLRALLVGYAWPGNVRELRNEAQRLVIQLDDAAPVTRESLNDRIRGRLVSGEPTRSPTGSLQQRLREFERQVVSSTLAECGNNKTMAAKVLGITREGLHKKLRQLKLGQHG